MDITEIDVLIETAEREIAENYKNIKKVMKNRAVANNQKAAKCEPFEESNKFLRYRIAFLLQLKDSKIPFYEKIPKQHNFYTHYIQSLKAQRMLQAANDKMEEDRMKFNEASEKIDYEKALSTK